MKKLKIIIYFTIIGVLLFNSIPLENAHKITTIETKKYLTPATEAGFESEELYRCVLDTLGKDQTSVTDEELSKITEVICRSSNITSTKGIEKLTSLRYLNLYGNKVTSIDLSKNTNLVMLNLTFNKISSIDISKNTNLQQLYLNGNNISSIDLSNNNKLLDLNIYNNKLTNINVSNLTELKFLLLSLNQLTSVDLSKNTKLEHVYLSGNKISTLTLPTSAPNLTRLDLNSNKLTNIDLTKLTNLNYLITSANSLTNLDLSQNTELEYLYSSSNKLSSIDLKNNIKLIDLDLYNNKLTSLNISNLLNLKYLNASLNKLTNLDLTGLSNLNKIYASSNELSDLSLTSQNSITEINAVFNQFDHYSINDKSKITYMVIEDEWLNNINLAEYSNLKRLDIDYYKIIPVYGNSISADEVVKNIPTNVTLNKYALYNGFAGISPDSKNICKYDVEYNVEGNTSSKETTTINTCKDITFNSNVINGNDAEYKRMQVYSEDISLNNKSTSAKIKFNGYYEIRFMTLKSDKYTIDNDNSIIDVDADNDATILKNLKLPWADAKININNNKLQVYYNNELLKEYTLKRIINPKTGSSYLYITISLFLFSIGILLFYSRNKKHN